MKRQYPFLAFLTGSFLIGGVLFAHAYDRMTTSSNEVAVTREDIPATAEVNGVEPIATRNQVPAVTPTPSQAPGKPVQSPKPTPAPQQSGYVNGTYNAAYMYRTPESIESISVTLAITNGTVTGASVQDSGNGRTSSRYQSFFESSYKQYVVGKSIASLRLSRVSGASLTTNAFNAAISAIRADATA